MENASKIYSLSVEEHLLHLIKKSSLQFMDCTEKFINYYKNHFDERFISAYNKANAEVKKLVKEQIDDETKKTLVDFYVHTLKVEAHKFAQEIFNSLKD